MAEANADAQALPDQDADPRLCHQDADEGRHSHAGAEQDADEGCDANPARGTVSDAHSAIDADADQGADMDADARAERDAAAIRNAGTERDVRAERDARAITYELRLAYLARSIGYSDTYASELAAFWEATPQRDADPGAGADRPRD